MADQIIIEMDGIKGECQLENYSGMIEVNSADLHFTNPADMQKGSGGGQGGKVQVHPINITKRTDISSVNLFKATTFGNTISSVKIHMIKQSAEKDYLTIELTDVMIAGWTMSAHENGDPMESFSLVFAKIQLTYAAQENAGDYSGDVIGSYDVKSGKTH